MPNSLGPTLDDLRDEQRAFIGPPEPPKVPKFTPVHERESVYSMMVENLVAKIAAESAAYIRK